MSSFCKSYSHFVSKNISVYAIFNDQSFNDTLTNDIVSFEQLGPELCTSQFLLPLDVSKTSWISADIDLNQMPRSVACDPICIVCSSLCV